jgi:hypothetical protein
MGKYHAPGGCGSSPRELTGDQVLKAETQVSVQAGHGRRMRRWHKFEFFLLRMLSGQ